MVLLGCKPNGRYTEQHDIYFGIANELAEMKSAMCEFWEESQGKLHIDAWRKVTHVDNHHIKVVERGDNTAQTLKLFFVNLGGYRTGDFEEYHYKQLIVAKTVEQAVLLAKETSFFQNHVSPHIDDKYGLDVDDVFVVEDVLSANFRKKFTLEITSTEEVDQDPVNIGYLKFLDL